jgi:putative nucleotidyltransferase with HDIG domain
VPEREECRRLLESHGVPPHIRRHSEQVARVTLRLGAALGAAGFSLDLDRLEAAALLHDIAKAECLGGRQDHAREGGARLRALGYPEVAALVERHVDLGAWDPLGEVTEAEVLNYADKRVRHEEVVTLGERFLDLLERYGKDRPAARARIRNNWRIMEELEAKLFARLPFGPDAL